MLMSGSDIAKYGLHLRVPFCDWKANNMIRINFNNIAD